MNRGLPPQRDDPQAPRSIRGRAAQDGRRRRGRTGSRATLYRLITAYRQTPTVEALEPRQRGRRKGALVLDKPRHDLIRKTIREVYLKPQRPTMGYLVGQVHLRFAQQGWPLPDRRTVKARVDEIERRFAARKRQDAAAIKATTPVPGQYKASRPLEVIQIDHTLVDLVVVDEETRAPLRRPWLTLAIDVFTRMIVGRRSKPHRSRPF